MTEKAAAIRTNPGTNGCGSFFCEVPNLPPHKTVVCTSEDEADCEGDDEGVVE